MLHLIESLLNDKIHQSSVINTNQISFSDQVVANCKMNHCGKYNKSWLCPPAIGDLNALKQKYQQFNQAMVFTKLYEIENAYDLEGMNKAKDDFNKDLLLMREELSNNHYELLGVGSCSICAECSYPDSPCKYPALAKPSVEAVGIDVVDLASKCQLNYYNGLNTVTYFGIIFFN